MNFRRLGAVFLVNLKLCAVEIFSNRVRTVITSFGIFMGVGALLSNLSFIRALEDDVKRNLESMGGLGIVTVRQVEAVTRQERMRFQQSGGLTYDEVKRIAADLPFVRRVLEVAELRWRPVTAGSKDVWAHVLAIGPDYDVAYNFSASLGRWFSEEEMARTEQVCIMGANIAKRLWAPGVNAVGKTVTYQGLPFKVIGIIKAESIRAERSSQCFIPYSVYRKRFIGFGHDEDEIAVLLTNSKEAENAQRVLSQRLLTAHRGAKDVDVEINKDRIAETKAASRGLQAILWCIAIISLLVGGISIMNIMFATIGDRIREIGIRKALGARREDIFTQFIIEAVLVCCVGGCPGMVLGWLVTRFPEGVFPFNPRLALSDYLLALGFTVAAGIFSGLSPALKAADMEPVEALRY